MILYKLELFVSLWVFVVNDLFLYFDLINGPLFHLFCKIIIFFIVMFINFEHRFVNLYAMSIMFTNFLHCVFLTNYTLKLTNLSLKLINSIILQKCLKNWHFLKMAQNSAILLRSPLRNGHGYDIFGSKAFLMKHKIYVLMLSFSIKNIKVFSNVMLFCVSFSIWH